MEISLEMIMSISGAITVITGAYFSIRKVQRLRAKDKSEKEEALLAKAKAHTDLVKSELENEINTLKLTIQTLEKSVEKDLEYLKEVYSNEIKNLGEKIEQIRDQLNEQHSQLLVFLTKLVDKE